MTPDDKIDELVELLLEIETGDTDREDLKTALISVLSEWAGCSCCERTI